MWSLLKFSPSNEHNCLILHFSHSTTPGNGRQRVLLHSNHLLNFLSFNYGHLGIWLYNLSLWFCLLLCPLPHSPRWLRKNWTISQVITRNKDYYGLYVWDKILLDSIWCLGMPWKISWIYFNVFNKISNTKTNPNYVAIDMFLLITI